MKSALWVIPATTLLVILAACQNTKQSSSSSRNQFGHTGVDGGTEIATTAPTPTPTPDTMVMENPAAPTPTPNVAPATQASREIPYGTPVPNKTGFVTSPYQPYAGYVDVRGYPPGTEVLCPYTKKIFLVP